MTSPTLFVSGASGHLGRLVIAALQSRGYDGKIIAGTRDPSKLADLKGVEVRKADFTDKAGLITALAGADKLLIISTDQIGTRLAGQVVAIEAAKAAGIKEIAYTSMPNPEAPSAITFAPEHFGTEEAIKASGIPYTILRMNWYTHNLLGALPNALAFGQWYTSVGDGKVNYVTREDCAKAAAGALLTTASNQTYTVSGPAALSATEIAALASAAAGKSLAVVNVSDEQLAAGAKAAGVPDFVIEHFIVAFDRNTREGKADVTTNAVETLWGTKPVSVAEFFKANAAALSAPPAPAAAAH
ncbi:NmrA family NAD(P)-binding protein [Devosia sp.]|uniref:NmrA family NAD(P)-binding protein n=1 Tax=Devosia sp. TaxID=1871048 RepID=UPI003BA9829C